MVPLLPQDPDHEGQRLRTHEKVHQGVPSRRFVVALGFHVRPQGPLAFGAPRCPAPALHTPPSTAPITLSQPTPVPLPAWQIDSEGLPNGLTLGEFLNDEDTKAIFRDRACVKTLSYKATLLGGLITKAEAIANSEHWVPAGAGEEPESDDDEPPSSAAAFPECVAGPSSPPTTKPPEPPATLAGGKRKSRAGA